MANTVSKTKIRGIIARLAATPKTDQDNANTLVNHVETTMTEVDTLASLAKKVVNKAVADTEKQLAKLVTDAPSDSRLVAAGERASRATTEAKRRAIGVAEAMKSADIAHEELAQLESSSNKKSVLTATEVDALKKAAARAQAVAESTLHATLRALEASEEADAMRDELEARIAVATAKKKVAQAVQQTSWSAADAATAAEDAQRAIQEAMEAIPSDESATWLTEVAKDAANDTKAAAAAATADLKAANTAAMRADEAAKNAKSDHNANAAADAAKASTDAAKKAANATAKAAVSIATFAEVVDVSIVEVKTLAAKAKTAAAKAEIAAAKAETAADFLAKHPFAVTDAVTVALRAVSRVIAQASVTTEAAIEAVKNALTEAEAATPKTGAGGKLTAPNFTQAAHAVLAARYAELALDLAANSSGLETSLAASAGKQPIPNSPNPDYAHLRLT